MNLFSVPMQGQGTADVESLPSYVLRLAYEHGVSAGVLQSTVYERFSYRGRIRKSVAGGPGIEALARRNCGSGQLRDHLSIVTGQDLSCRPLDFLENRVYMISTEIGGFRWCPECLSEMSQVGVPRYIKQLWHMTAVTHCQLHRSPLVDECPKCDSKQVFMRNDVQIGWCGKCRHSLSTRKKPLTPDDIQPSWECISYDISEVFEKTARGDKTGSDIHLYCQAGASMLRDYIKFMAFDHKLPPEFKPFLEEYARNPFQFWRLTTMRRLAYLLNVSLYQLLSNDHESLPFPYDLSAIKNMPAQIKPRKKVVRNHKQEYQKIVALIEAQTAPPSLKRLAKLANVSVGYMEYRFPSLVRKVVDESQAYLKNEKLIRQYRAQEAAIRFFTDPRYADYNQSRKEAYRVLREETGLPKWVLKNAIQAAYGALHVEN